LVKKQMGKQSAERRIYWILIPVECQTTHMRPKLQFLTTELIEQIVEEAFDVLASIGLEINNDNVVNLLLEHGAEQQKNGRILLCDDLITQTLKTTPHSFNLYDIAGKQTHDLSGNNVYFNPGSTALNILDHGEHPLPTVIWQTPPPQLLRKPTSWDYLDYVKIVSQLEHIAAQSTAFIPSDIPAEHADSYRLMVSLMFCEKPVVTGCFTIESFEIMKDFQVIVRGSEQKLKEKPLTVFSICPTSPLKWSKTTSQNLLDCARYSIPVEFIAMPLSGLVAPVTLLGSLVQHTAETLSGIVISQLANPGTPILYGGSPAVFDMRHATTPMGAIETQMIDCAYCEIGKYFGLPTQAYIGFSDSKRLDAQAGSESAVGAVLAGLTGINSVSGPGMLDFESAQSLEKLIFDNDICGSVLRLTRGIEQEDTSVFQELFQELIQEKNLLASEHTLKHFKNEHFHPSEVIDRKTRDAKRHNLRDRANYRLLKLLRSYKGPQRHYYQQDLRKRMEEVWSKSAKNEAVHLDGRKN